jgi:hypothetical protein
MHVAKYFLSGMMGATAVLVVGGRLIPGNSESGPVIAAAASVLATPTFAPPKPDEIAASEVVSNTKSAVKALREAVRPLSHPKALEAAFRGYFAFKARHPDEVRKPFLYFVDYGLPSTEPRGYVFDMRGLKVVEGPFTVAHGRGSSKGQYGVPTRFSNRPGSAASSLGLFLAQETYPFRGKSGGDSYRSIGLRLWGVSGRFNDNARERGVVAHGAPYVTADKAGRSEGCPAMEQHRARRLIPKLADGGMVFLFAPDSQWMSRDQWIAATSEDSR